MTTKTQSYYQTIAEGLSERHRQVLDYLAIAGEPKSRAKISEYTGLSLQCVCGRVNELIKMGMLVVGGNAFDFNTQRIVETVTINQSGEGIKPLEKKASNKQLREYVDYLKQFLRDDVDVCSLEQWCN